MSDPVTHTIAELERREGELIDLECRLLAEGQDEAAALIARELAPLQLVLAMLVLG